MILKGKVTVNSGKDVAEFASVYISDSLGTNIKNVGTKTDLDGKFSLDTTKASSSDYITFASIDTKKIVPFSSLSCGKTTCDTIVDLGSGSQLEEVVITAKKPKKCDTRCKFIIGVSILALIVFGVVIYKKVKK